jgi:hypothetical protein
VKRILGSVAVLLVLAGTFVYRRYLAPSGDIDRFRRYSLPQKDAIPRFDFLVSRLSADGIEFGILQGYQSVMLFDREPSPSNP